MAFPVRRCDHLESFLDHARQSYARGRPRYVEQAFRDYLAMQRLRTLPDRRAASIAYGGNALTSECDIMVGSRVP
jgi:hypothetical protein